MRYASLVITSLLAASHVCHGKPLPTPADPPYSEGFPSEAESISTTSAEETTYPGLYPTDTEDFPSKAAETRTTTATKAFEPVTVSATATEAKSAEFPAATGEHSSEEHSGAEAEHSDIDEGHSANEEHSGANEDQSVANEEEHKPVETSASGASEEHGAPSDHEAHSGDAESFDDETDSDDEAASHQDAPSEYEASSEHDAPSDHDASSDNEDWSQHEAPPAEASPKPHDQDRPCGKLDPWTIHSLSRQCDDADMVCGWSFIVDTNCPSLAPTPCTFSIKSLGPGVPASRSPKHEKGLDELCGPYEVHSSWSGQFGPGQGFTTLSVIDGGNKLVAYPAYRDDLFEKEKGTVPDVEVAVYALG